MHAPIPLHDLRAHDSMHAPTLDSANPDAPVDARARATGGLKSRVRAFLFGGPEDAQQIGRFRIRRALGRGGMGTVFLAFDEELDRQVALKLVRADRVSRRAQERLRREARALAKLSHPNVVPVFEVGEHEGLIFVAMEYVEGQNMRDWLDAETRSRDEILAVFEQAGQGLAAAHLAGLVHRDFKPENVVVGLDRRVRVVDFGLVAADGSESLDGLPDGASIASVLAEGGESAELVVDAPLTQTGELMGTPAYMAPEQFLGDPPTPASDQFSFFAALYEALEEAPPFAGKVLADLMKSVLAGQLRAPQRKDLSASLRKALARGLSREPGQRFASMSAALDVLRPTGPRFPRPPWWRREFVPLSALVLLGGLGVLVSRGGDDPAAAAATGVESGTEGAPLDGRRGEPKLVSPWLDTEREVEARGEVEAMLQASDDAERIELAQRFLARVGTEGDPALIVIAEASLGSALWRQSCARSLDDGLCVTTRPADASLGCTGQVGPLYTVVARDAVLAAEAREHLETATAMVDAGANADGKEFGRAFSQHVGRARLDLADARLEPYLGIEIPVSLAFDDDKPLQGRKELSEYAFGQFMGRKQSALQELLPLYARVRAAGDPASTMRAASRSARAQENLHDSLLSIPAPTRTDDERAAYCEVLSTQVAPLRGAARGAYEACVITASEAKLEDPLAAECAARVEQLGEDR